MGCKAFGVKRSSLERWWVDVALDIVYCGQRVVVRVSETMQVFYSPSCQTPIYRIYDSTSDSDKSMPVLSFCACRIGIWTIATSCDSAWWLRRLVRGA